MARSTSAPLDLCVYLGSKADIGFGRVSLPVDGIRRPEADMQALYMRAFHMAHYFDIHSHDRMDSWVQAS